MRKNAIWQILKATCAAIVFSLAFALIFTLIIHLCSLPSAVIKPVNQVFKIIAIAAGGLLFIRGEKGLIKGAIYGVTALICTYLLFSLIGGRFSFSYLMIVEILIGGAAGAISGVLAVNLRSS